MHKLLNTFQNKWISSLIKLKKDPTFTLLKNSLLQKKWSLIIKRLLLLYLAMNSDPLIKINQISKTLCLILNQHHWKKSQKFKKTHLINSIKLYLNTWIKWFTIKAYSLIVIDPRILLIIAKNLNSIQFIQIV